MVKVNFSIENIMKCLCPQCPVQSSSKCVKGKKEMFNKTKNIKIETMKAEDFPGIYCSSGFASCKDIDTKQMCICGSCPVWAEYDLAGGKPRGYFCRYGIAK